MVFFCVEICFMCTQKNQLIRDRIGRDWAEQCRSAEAEIINYKPKNFCSSTFVIRRRYESHGWWLSIWSIVQAARRLAPSLLCPLSFPPSRPTESVSINLRLNCRSAAILWIFRLFWAVPCPAKEELHVNFWKLLAFLLTNTPEKSWKFFLGDLQEQFSIFFMILGEFHEGK